MAEAESMADAAIGSEEEEEETDIKFRAERNQMGEVLDFLGVEKTASPIK